MLQIAQIVDDIKLKYGCHTVILYGSRARGDSTETSDYDIAAFRDDSEETIRDARQWNGYYLDAWIYPSAKATQPDESMLHLRGGLVLCEQNNLATSCLQALEEIYQCGPTPLPKWDALMRKTWVEKMLKRIEVGDVEANYRRCWLLFELLEYYFLFRGLWYPGPKQAFAWLQVNDLQTYGLFQQALLLGSNAEAITALAASILADFDT